MTQTELEQVCRAVLNSGALTSSTTPTSGNDPKFPDDHITRCVKLGIEKVLGEIAMNANDPRRVALIVISDSLAATPLSSPPLSFTADLKLSTVQQDHIGPVGSVYITIGSETRIGIADTADAVDRRLSNVLGLQIPVFYYSLSGEFFRHTGDSAKVEFVPKSAISDASNLLGDDDIQVVAYALAVLVNFEGGKTESAEHFRALAAQAVAEHRSAMTGMQPQANG